MKINRNSWHYRLSSLLFNHWWTNSSCQYISKVTWSVILFFVLIPIYIVFTLPILAAGVYSEIYFGGIFVGSIYNGVLLLSWIEFIGALMAVITVVCLTATVIAAGVFFLSYILVLGLDNLDPNGLLVGIKDKFSGVCTRVDFE